MGLHQMTVLEKSLSLSFILSKMLEVNIQTAVLEMRAQKNYDTGKLDDKLMRLSGVNKRCFSIIERNLSKSNALTELEENINQLITASWEN